MPCFIVLIYQYCVFVDATALVSGVLYSSLLLLISSCIFVYNFTVLVVATILYCNYHYYVFVGAPMCMYIFLKKTRCASTS